MSRKMARTPKFPSHWTVYLRSHWKDAAVFRLLYRGRPQSEWSGADFELAVPEILSEATDERATREPLDKSEAKKLARLFVEAAQEWAEDTEKRCDFSIAATYHAGDVAPPSEPAYRYDPVWNDAEADEDKPASARKDSEVVALIQETRAVFRDSHKWMRERHQLGTAQLRQQYEHARETVEMQLQAARPLLEMRREEINAQLELEKAQTFNTSIMSAIEAFGPAAQTYAQAEFIKAQQAKGSTPDPIDKDPVRLAFLELLAETTRGEFGRLCSMLPPPEAAKLADISDRAHSCDAGELKTVLLEILPKLDPKAAADLRPGVLRCAMALRSALS